MPNGQPPSFQPFGALHPVALTNAPYSLFVTGVEAMARFFGPPMTSRKPSFALRASGRRCGSEKRAMLCSMRCSRSRSISSTITFIPSTLDLSRAVRRSSSCFALFRATTAS